MILTYDTKPSTGSLGYFYTQLQRTKGNLTSFHMRVSTTHRRNLHAPSLLFHPNNDASAPAILKKRLFSVSKNHDASGNRSNPMRRAVAQRVRPTSVCFQCQRRWQSKVSQRPGSDRYARNQHKSSTKELANSGVEYISLVQ